MASKPASAHSKSSDATSLCLVIAEAFVQGVQKKSLVLPMELMLITEGNCGSLVSQGDGTCSAAPSLAAEQPLPCPIL